MTDDRRKWKDQSEQREPWNYDRDKQWKRNWNDGWNNYTSGNSSSSQWENQGSHSEQREQARGKGKAAETSKAVRKLGDAAGKAATALMDETDKANAEYKASVKGVGKAAAKKPKLTAS